MTRVSAPARSRAEALRRSLLAVEALPDEAQILQVRASQWPDSMQPLDGFQSWLVGHVAELSLRVDRCGRSERRLRDRASLRAEVCWGDDHRSQAEVIGGKLAARPAEAVDRLRRTAAGCDWLIRRWALLARAADQGPWTADQIRLAWDLLATPAEFRQGQPGEAIDDQGRVIHKADDPAAVARRQIAGLAERRDRLAGSEEVDRALVIAGQFDNACPEIRRLRRHEAALRRQIRWCLAQVRPAPTAPGPRPEVPFNPLPPARPSRPSIDPGPLDWSEIQAEIEAEIDPETFEEARRQTLQMIAGFRHDEPRRPGPPRA
jgi:hypothetical protein